MKSMLKKGNSIRPSKCMSMPWFWASFQPAFGLRNLRMARCRPAKLMVGTWISCWAPACFQGLLMMLYMFFFREAFKESSPQKLSKVEFTSSATSGADTNRQFFTIPQLFRFNQTCQRTFQSSKKCQSFEPNIFFTNVMVCTRIHLCYNLED